jgi:EAL domain-containing protein (putative c-di-GMP-specific phosphodiesterase class I)
MPRKEPEMSTAVDRLEIDLPWSGAPEEPIERLLTLARAGVGMEAAFFVAFEPEHEYVQFVEGESAAFGLGPYEETPLARHGREAVEGLAPTIVRDATVAEGIDDSPALRSAGVGAALCVPVELSHGRLVGAVCCVRGEPDPSLDETDAMFVRVLANSIADELEQQELELEVAELGSERIRDVLQGDHLDIVFQPIFDFARDEVIAYEALARFQREPHRPPPAWFSEASDVGLGLDLELAAVKAALEHAGDLPPGVRIALNVSPGVAASQAFFSVLAGFEDRVLVELTEHDDVGDYHVLKRALQALRARGALVAVDDAGVGFASFERIVRLRPDVVKVDIRAKGVVTDPTRRALVAALIFFASTTNATIVAEGIETPSELELVRRLKIAYGQGSWLGVPGPFPA